MLCLNLSYCTRRTCPGWLAVPNQAAPEAQERIIAGRSEECCTEALSYWEIVFGHTKFDLLVSPLRHPPVQDVEEEDDVNGNRAGGGYRVASWQHEDVPNKE